MSVEIEHLRRFLAVAEELHFSRAAELLHIAQPALSTSIRKLEELLGLRLFARNTRVVDLTPEGRIFVEAARDVVDAYDRALVVSDRLRGVGGGPVTLGVYTAAGSEVKRAIVNRILEINPEIDLTVVSESTYRLIESVDEGSVDIGLCLAPAGTGRLKRTLVGPEPMSVVLPRSHPLAERASLRLEDLADEIWILPGNRMSRDKSVLARFGQDAGFTMRLSDAVSDFDEDFSEVAAGRGITAVPTASIRRRFDDVSFVPILGIKTPLYLVSRPDAELRSLHSVIQAILDVKQGSRGAPAN